jgi:hypothetical protein
MPTPKSIRITKMAVVTSPPLGILSAALDTSAIAVSWSHSPVEFSIVREEGAWPVS